MLERVTLQSYNRLGVADRTVFHHFKSDFNGDKLHIEELSFVKMLFPLTHAERLINKNNL